VNRRIMAGLFALICLSVGSVALAPRTASALSPASNCDTRLAICADNAADNFENCVCDVAPNTAFDCKMFNAAPSFGLAPNSPNSIPACVVQEQGDLVRCQGAYLICKITGGGNPTTANR
jgi:hypothetical protein